MNYHHGHPAGIRSYLGLNAPVSERFPAYRIILYLLLASLSTPGFAQGLLVVQSTNRLAAFLPLYDLCQREQTGICRWVVGDRSLGMIFFYFSYLPARWLSSKDVFEYSYRRQEFN
jgi:hypothetical protein